jgi:carboxypeptidase family protein
MRSTIQYASIFHTLFAILVVVLASIGQAQAQIATLSGTITDITGAVVPKALVSLEIADSPHLQTTADGDGHFAIEAAPGEYILRTSAQGFMVLKKTVHLTAAIPAVENISLSVAQGGGACSPCVAIEPPIEILHASLDLLLPLRSLPPYGLHVKNLKHSQR